MILFSSQLLKNEFDDIKRYVRKNIIPFQKKEVQNGDIDNVSFAYMISCTKACMEIGITPLKNEVIK